MKKPKVSILCLTYNQATFVRQTFDSFLAQETSFTYEVLINDDASTDGTREIIEEYVKKYPSIFKAVFHDQNLYSQGTRNMIIRFLLPHAQGKFLAICEGDDYWTDPEKLQQQVDFLEKNPSYTVCFHSVRVSYDSEDKTDLIVPNDTYDKGFDIQDLLKNNFIQTNSVMYRKLDKYTNLVNDVMPGDWYLHLYHASKGKIHFIDKTMAVYRKHPGGIWWESQHDMQQIWKKHGVQYMGLLVQQQKLFGSTNNYREIIGNSIIKHYQNLIDTDREQDTDLLAQVTERYPYTAKFFIEKQNASLQEGQLINAELREKINNLIGEINTLRFSRSYRVGYSLLHPKVFSTKMKSFISSLIKDFKFRINAIKAAKQYDKSLRIIESNRYGSKKIAVVLHLYYPDLWEYFNKKLAVLNPSDFDLFVTIMKDDKSSEDAIKSNFPDACILPVPNWGRDVLPFMKITEILNRKGYEYVLKLHSKKSKHRADGHQWLDGIVENLLPANEVVLKELNRVLNKTNTAIIGPADQYVSLTVNYRANRKHILRIITDVKGNESAKYIDSNAWNLGFFGGTMFWARLDALQPTLDQQYSAIDFERESGQIDSTFAHALERTFCLIAEIDNKKLYEMNGEGVSNVRYSSGTVPPWSDMYDAFNKKIRNEIYK